MSDGTREAAIFADERRGEGRSQGAHERVVRNAAGEGSRAAMVRKADNGQPVSQQDNARSGGVTIEWWCEVGGALNMAPNTPRDESARSGSCMAMRSCCCCGSTIMAWMSMLYARRVALVEYEDVRVCICA